MVSGQLKPRWPNFVLPDFVQAIKHDFPISAVLALPNLEFEARKDAAQVIGAIVRLDNGGDVPGVQYVVEKPKLLESLFLG